MEKKYCKCERQLVDDKPSSNCLTTREGILNGNTNRKAKFKIQNIQLKLEVAVTIQKPVAHKVSKIRHTNPTSIKVSIEIKGSNPLLSSKIGSNEKEHIDYSRAFSNAASANHVKNPERHIFTDSRPSIAEYDHTSKKKPLKFSHPSENFQETYLSGGKTLEDTVCSPLEQAASTSNDVVGNREDEEEGRKETTWPNENTPGDETENDSYSNDTVSIVILSPIKNPNEVNHSPEEKNYLSDTTPESLLLQVPESIDQSDTTSFDDYSDHPHRGEGTQENGIIENPVTKSECQTSNPELIMGTDSQDSSTYLGCNNYPGSSSSLNPSTYPDFINYPDSIASPYSISYPDSSVLPDLSVYPELSTYSDSSVIVTTGSENIGPLEKYDEDRSSKATEPTSSTGSNLDTRNSKKTDSQNQKESEGLLAADIETPDDRHANVVLNMPYHFVSLTQHGTSSQPENIGDVHSLAHLEHGNNKEEGTQIAVTFEPEQTTENVASIEVISEKSTRPQFGNKENEENNSKTTELNEPALEESAVPSTSNEGYIKDILSKTAAPDQQALGYDNTDQISNNNEQVNDVIESQIPIAGTHDPEWSVENVPTLVTVLDKSVSLQPDELRYNSDEEININKEHDIDATGIQTSNSFIPKAEQSGEIVPDKSTTPASEHRSESIENKSSSIQTTKLSTPTTEENTAPSLVNLTTDNLITVSPHQNYTNEESDATTKQGIDGATTFELESIESTFTPSPVKETNTSPETTFLSTSPENQDSSVTGIRDTSVGYTSSAPTSEPNPVTYQTDKSTVPTLGKPSNGEEITTTRVGKYHTSTVAGEDVLDQDENVSTIKPLVTVTSRYPKSPNSNISDSDSDMYAIAESTEVSEPAIGKTTIPKTTQESFNQDQTDYPDHKELGFGSAETVGITIPAHQILSSAISSEYDTMSTGVVNQTNDTAQLGVNEKLESPHADTHLPLSSLNHKFGAIATNIPTAEQVSGMNGNVPVSPGLSEETTVAEDIHVLNQYETTELKEREGNVAESQTTSKESEVSKEQDIGGTITREPDSFENSFTLSPVTEKSTFETTHHISSPLHEDSSITGIPDTSKGYTSSAPTFEPNHVTYQTDKSAVPTAGKPSDGKESTTTRVGAYHTSTVAGEDLLDQDENVSTKKPLVAESSGNDEIPNSNAETKSTDVSESVVEKTTQESLNQDHLKKTDYPDHKEFGSGSNDMVGITIPMHQIVLPAQEVQSNYPSSDTAPTKNDNIEDSNKIVDHVLPKPEDETTTKANFAIESGIPYINAISTGVVNQTSSTVQLGVNEKLESPHVHIPLPSLNHRFGTVATNIPTAEQVSDMNGTVSISPGLSEETTIAEDILSLNQYETTELKERGSNVTGSQTTNEESDVIKEQDIVGTITPEPDLFENSFTASPVTEKDTSPETAHHSTTPENEDSGVTVIPDTSQGYTSSAPTFETSSITPNITTVIVSNYTKNISDNTIIAIKKSDLSKLVQQISKEVKNNNMGKPPAAPTTVQVTKSKVIEIPINLDANRVEQEQFNASAKGEKPTETVRITKIVTTVKEIMKTPNNNASIVNGTKSIIASITPTYPVNNSEVIKQYFNDSNSPLKKAIIKTETITTINQVPTDTLGNSSTHSKEYIASKTSFSNLQESSENTYDPDVPHRHTSENKNYEPEKIGYKYKQAVAIDRDRDNGSAKRQKRKVARSNDDRRYDTLSSKYIAEEADHIQPGIGIIQNKVNSSSTDIASIGLTNADLASRSKSRGGKYASETAHPLYKRVNSSKIEKPLTGGDPDDTTKLHPEKQAYISEDRRYTLSSKYISEEADHVQPAIGIIQNKMNRNIANINETGLTEADTASQADSNKTYESETAKHRYKRATRIPGKISFSKRDTNGNTKSLASKYLNAEPDHTQPSVGMAHNQSGAILSPKVSNEFAVHQQLNHTFDKLANNVAQYETKVSASDAIKSEEFPREAYPAITRDESDIGIQNKIYNNPELPLPSLPIRVIQNEISNGLNGNDVDAMFVEKGVGKESIEFAAKYESPIDTINELDIYHHERSEKYRDQDASRKFKNSQRQIITTKVLDREMEMVTTVSKPNVVGVVVNVDTVNNPELPPPPLPLRDIMRGIRDGSFDLLVGKLDSVADEIDIYQHQHVSTTSEASTSPKS
ncbi:unnamed protein product [Acanthoscelides obtectus]|uniref:Uncharacterized protein n=1 Tax=Acanthoscelides obtectus TaxID=200917 RepID=A0A9P0PVB6_ACAOB|nr:unnamed protein product [Acanthoscelides obtectus]CAK1672160.1 hypothetical protein AOBTE_LOCUS28687 [Acanthoscelides obtectus]